MQNPDRRSFLKGVAAGAVATAVRADAAVASDGVADSQEKTRPSSTSGGLVGQVNLLQGTNSTYQFSRGNTLPISALPFGMAHWTLQSSLAGGAWFFQPNDRRIEGVRCTHQLSPWLNDYGFATFLPIGESKAADAAARATSYRPEESTLSPAELKIDLLRYGIQMELVPTMRGAILCINHGPQTMAAAGLAIDLPGITSEIQLDTASALVRCNTSFGHGGLPPGFHTYYVLQFSGHATTTPLRLEDTTNTKNQKVAVLRYATKAGSPVEVRIASSFISYEQAELNLKTELLPFSTDQLRVQAKATWEDHLSRARVEGGTTEQRRTFYSCMYRALLFPRTWHEINASGETIHRSAFNGKVEPGVMYADHGYWDVYRAWYPWMSVLFPKRLGEILQAWVNAYREGGWLPQFPAPGYRACMTGSLIDAVFADAVVKDISGFDRELAYEALRKHATIPGNADKGYGRRGIEDYLKLGFVAEDHTEQSAAETVDAAYGDFCIAQIAERLGHKEDAAMFRKRSANWRNLFDARTGFLRGKTSDGKWVEPFDPIRWGSPFVEGAAWQHRWDVPHDIDGLFEAMGGKKVAADALETMITRPADFNVGSYGKEIHEISEMAAVHFGQYSHGNQPVHHVLYLFSLAGRPDRTRYWTKRVMQELYSPDNFAGDEDTGSMAAWFLSSACGFYPVCPGKPEYVFGAPLFEKITLTFEDKQQLILTSRNAAKMDGKINIDGRASDSTVIQHKDLLNARRIDFT